MHDKSHESQGTPRHHRFTACLRPLSTRVRPLEGFTAHDACVAPVSAYRENHGPNQRHAQATHCLAKKISGR